MEPQTPLVCAIYKSPKKEECYLYIDKRKGLNCIPQELAELFGKPVEVMTMILKHDKPLARVDVKNVIAGLQDKGYYLQLPPPMDPEMQKIHQQNSKIPR